MFKFSTSIVKIFLFFLVSGAVSDPSALAQQDNFSIKSEILQETREIVVHLPENYDPDSKEGYLVIYMLDADHEADEIAARTAGASQPNFLRELKTRLAFKPCRQAISDTDTSDAFASATILRLNSSSYRRRGALPLAIISVHLK